MFSHVGTSSPLVLEKLQNATVMEGERVVLRCRALNDPNATSRWIKRNADSANVIILTVYAMFIKCQSRQIDINTWQNL